MSSIDLEFLADEKFGIIPSSNRKSSKRKSFENAENVDANIVSAVEDADAKVIKKSKVLAPLNVENADPSGPGARLRSGLPRYQQKPKPPSLTPRSKGNTNSREKTSNVRGAIIIDTTANATPIKGSSSMDRPGSIEKVAATPGALVPPPTTPRISNNPFIRKLQREILSEVTGVYLSSVFDNSFGFIDDKVNTSMNTLKVKSKWDVKEKMKRQEAVIKELRDIVTLIQDGIKHVKDSCFQFEQKMFNSFRETYDHLVDSAQTLASARFNEKKFLKDNENLLNEVKLLTAKVEQSKTEFINKLKNMETKMLLTDKENELLKERLQEADQRYQEIKRDFEEVQKTNKLAVEKVSIVI
jgi:hypothetical protein